MKSKNYFIIVIALFAIITSCNAPKNQQLPIDEWTYIEIDSTREKWGDYGQPAWLKYFGLDFSDVNNDGYLDIVAGKHFYTNPTGKMEGHWSRVDIAENVDGLLFVNADDDESSDIIAQALPNVYWCEASNVNGTEWALKLIDSIPANDHVNGQGFKYIDIVNGGKEEILIASARGIYACEIPENTDQYPWGFKLIVATGSHEGFGVGDIDGDGDNDIAFSEMNDTIKTLTKLKIAINPGNINEEWVSYEIGTTTKDFDRIEIADFNDDGNSDIATTEEMWPGLEPEANVCWFKAPEDPIQGAWEKIILKTQYSTNNMSIGDVDNDGDIDIITCEHKGSEFNLQIWQNDGHGMFTENIVDKGKESHLGAKVVDLDNDGDLDIVSIAWDNYKYMHVWRNDAIVKE